MDINDNKMWPWECNEYSLEDDHVTLDISDCVWNNETQNEEDFLCIFSDETTPVKDSGDMDFIVSKKNNMNSELEESRDISSQGKSRRALQFDSNGSGFSKNNDEMSTFRRLNDMVNSVEDDLYEISDWMPQNPEQDILPGCTAVSYLETLNQLEEGWIESCFTDLVTQINPSDMNVFAESDVQIDIAELQNSEIKQGTRVIQNKAYMETPKSISSSSYVVYPFDILKLSDVKGDMSLKDINQKIHSPPPETRKRNEDPAMYPIGAFSGKPVVKRTKIHTKGRRGSITIMRTIG